MCNLKGLCYNKRRFLKEPNKPKRKQHVKRWKHKDLFPTHAADTSTAGARVTSATAASASGSVASSGTNINSQPANIDSGDGNKDSELGVSNGD
ncbi:hypothetical protein K7X08_004998 [Anisodus acutangulus]|uniref:Uncharacterized protein n=1 Tax=Anisodus acutangulus TaxID=402998 RepID=A0A9Q1MEH7_9SOLA|nr:hypothetical protein K7X08_004998 [Anisodus acutangulus]